MAFKMNGFSGFKETHDSEPDWSKMDISANDPNAKQLMTTKQIGESGFEGDRLKTEEQLEFEQRVGFDKDGNLNEKIVHGGTAGPIALSKTIFDIGKRAFNR